MGKLTEIVCVLDRSGSMASIRDDAIGGFNTFLEGQKAVPGEARITLALFNDVYTVVHDSVPLADVPPLTEATFVPHGQTALLDAVGKAVSAVVLRQMGTPEDERPSKTLVAILTDGQENASHEHSRQAVRAMIETQQKSHGWEFVFLAANQDAFAEAGMLGIPKANAVNFVASAAGTRSAYDDLNSRSTSYRGH